MMARDIDIQFAPVPDGTRWQVIVEREVTTLDVAIVDHAELNVPYDPDSLDALRTAIEKRALERLAEGKTCPVGTPVEQTHVVTWNPEGGAAAEKALDCHTGRLAPVEAPTKATPAHAPSIQPTHETDY